MKKKIFLGVLCAAVILLLLFIFYPQAKYRNNYKIDAVLNTKLNIITGTETVTYCNTGNVALNQIYFHVYPNTYANNEILDKRGKIDIHSVSVNSADADYKVLGVDNTLLKVNLKKLLKPNRRLSVRITFKLFVPYNMYGDRLSYNKFAYNLGNWYPIAAVYDEKGWNLDPYYSLGDPFYSESADYEVNITTPKQYIVAATGNPGETKILKENKVYNFKEKNVRDFAMVISDKFKVKEEKVDGINIKCYCLDGTNKRNELAMKVAKDSIKIFNKRFGKYPYNNFSVVATTFATGMEYPELVYINKDFYLAEYPNDNGLENVITHETAHQWWYGVVGDNEVDEAWLDEGFANYSEIIYYEDEYNKALAKRYFDDNMKVTLDTVSRKEVWGETINDYVRTLQNDVIVRSLPKFDSQDEYVRLVYKKSATLLNDLRNKIGDKTFFKIMSDYYKKYKFKVATTQGFIETVDKDTDNKWDTFFKNGLYDKHIELMTNLPKQEKWYEKVKDNVLRKLGFSKYTQGQLIKMKYFDAIFSDDWNNTEADEFVAANTKNLVRWTAHVTFINNKNLITLGEGNLPDIWASFNGDEISKNKIHVGELLTIQGNLENYKHSSGFIIAYKPPMKDPPQWVIGNCKIEKTTALEKKDLEEYLKKNK